MQFSINHSPRIINKVVGDDGTFPNSRLAILIYKNAIALKQIQILKKYRCQNKTPYMAPGHYHNTGSEYYITSPEVNVGSLKNPEAHLF